MIMKSREKGLTVGELTMTIGVLLIASLIWSSCSKQEKSEEKALGPTNFTPATLSVAIRSI